MSKSFSGLDFSSQYSNLVDKKLISLLKLPIETSVVPVNLHVSQSDLLLWYSGLALLEDEDQSAEFFLNQLSISRVSIRYSPRNLHYLDQLFEGGQILESGSPRKLASDFGKNYNQFQSDCRNHFGDTFHQFQNKMKMLDVVCDVLFTSYSLKEIAYRNNFFNYNSMYILFRNKYEFPIDSIPRLLTEI
ncbi:hypothetical protein [Chryseobacterium sp. SL1]|uniref:hypothetical protein n=1 Tax=Chryseobacterium sp. SL1 TaxID=2995159 RepID=UPI00227CC44F|nr:hypothetical protein [Chryseobacterium sp. SL1]